jgi:ArsR family transcriptional regulator, arsenate/arsenite/antimonite-responsive transcriptional repressor
MYGRESTERFFQAISDPTRQKILSMLESQDKMCVNELVRKLSVSQPTVSKHLSLLKSVGIVVCKREGQQVFYSINGKHMRFCCTSFFGKFSCCSEFFDKPGN